MLSIRFQEPARELVSDSLPFKYLIKITKQDHLIVFTKMKNIETRKIYIDNLKIFLVTLVMLLHIAVTYGPIGFWYYYERTGLLSTYLLGFFVSFNQAFLLGFFLMISAYFIIPSYDRKGPELFIRDKFRRLGIPLLFYIIIIGPFLIYIQKLFIAKEKVSFLYFYYNFIIKNIIIEAGPLWFLQALLILSIFYILLTEIIKKVSKKKAAFEKKGLDFPQNYKIILFIISLAIVTFLVRIRFPIETSIINLQLCFLPQYVSLFILGIFAYRNNWFEKITYKKAVFWLSVLAFTTLLWPVLLFFSGTFKEADITLIAGGFRWQAFLYAFLNIGLKLIKFLCIPFGCGARDNQWSSGIINQYRVNLIHNSIIMRALNQFIRECGHVISQVVKTKFIIGTISNICKVSIPSVLRIGLVSVNAIYS